MSKYARIENGTALEIFTPSEGFKLADCFTPEIAALFMECPDNVTAGSTVDSNGEWEIAPVPELPPNNVTPAEVYEPLTPMTLYMAFTPDERIAIKASSDPYVKEFWEMYQLSVQLNKPTDPNLVSVQNALGYLTLTPESTPPGPGILQPERVAQILAGIPQ